MRLAQTLYENGYITYMRTDSAKYSKDFIKSAKTFINDKYGKNYINKKINLLSNSNKKKRLKQKKEKDNNAQEAHEAIRPTDINKTTLIEKGKIGAREIKLYYLIWCNTKLYE